METTIGKPLRRTEDLRLLVGAGRYSDDVSLPGQAHAAMVRSPHAHARIGAIDAAAALAMPGVLAVLTAADWLADGLGPIPHGPVPSGGADPTLTGPNGSAPRAAPHFPLPSDKARYAGEAVAMVIAETAAGAQDGAEAVAVQWEELPAVTDAREALMDGKPQVWDLVPGNLCVDCTVGDAAATDAAFARAAHVVRHDFHIARVTGVTMEPRAALGAYDAAGDSYTLYAGSGGTVRHKAELVKLFNVPGERMRVVAQDVGGNYGTRNRIYPEFPLVLWASRRLGRPVKWTAGRGEAMVSDLQGRDLHVTLELALDAEGTFLALRSSNISNIGGQTVSYVPLAKGAGIATGPYHFPVASLRLRAAVTNTPPTNPYRSAGRPEVIYALERLVDMAARRCGFDRVALRRRNLIPADRMPYTNPQGMIYDSGAFAQCLDMALQLADMDGYGARRAGSKARGRRRGIGIAPYIETSGGSPVERADITVTPDGEVIVVVGTQSSGQGHETSFAQVAADWLGVPHDVVRVVQGDTAVVKAGGGSHAGRSMRMAGTAIVLASEKVIDKGRRLAAHVLEAAAEDIAFSAGTFFIRGTDRAIGIFALAAEAARHDLPAELQGGLADGVQNRMDVPVFPNGCHVCEVEVDPDTGTVRLDRYSAVDDVGRVINPLIVDGQIHGGIVQGAGQALMESCVFDPTGQPLAGSLMDYALPRADDMPSFSVRYNEVLCAGNPLGVKSGGESGTTPALAVISNAVMDALEDLGVEDIPMPLTAQRIWKAVRARN